MKTFKKIEWLNLPNFEDDRGTFTKLFARVQTELKGFDVEQVNLVDNPRKGVLRGLHYQNKEFSEAKIFKILSGSIQLAAFCWDNNNPEYLKSYSFELSDKSNSILIPKGFATGYLVLDDDTKVIYISDNIYNSECENGLRWNDPVLEIEWKSIRIEVSEKDKRWKDFEKN